MKRGCHADSLSALGRSMLRHYKDLQRQTPSANFGYRRLAPYFFGSLLL